MIVDKIGLPATLQQCAEECLELALACLKMSRKLEGVNPTPKTFEEIHLNFIEEVADVSLCIDVLTNEAELTYSDIIDSIKESKNTRWLYRIEQAAKEAGETNELS